MRRLLWIVPSLICLALVTALLLRRGELTPEQQAALALMEAPMQRAQGRRNAIAMLWSIGYDLPEEAVESLFQEDVATAWRLGKQWSWPPAMTSAAGRYAEVPLPTAFHCVGFSICVDEARANLAEAQQWIAKHSRYVARAEALFGFDHVVGSEAIAPNARTLPNANIIYWHQAAAAVALAGGQHETSLKMICEGLNGMRRLRSRVDSQYFQGTLTHHAESYFFAAQALLERLPADVALPEVCERAFAEPKADEFDRCDIGRGEFRRRKALFIHARQKAQANPLVLPGVLDSVWNQRAAEAKIALQFVHYCPGHGIAAPERPTARDWLVDPLGSMGTPSSQQESIRSLESSDERFAKQIQALRIMRWLAQQSDLDQAWEQLPPTYRAYSEGIALRWALDRSSGDQLPFLVLPYKTFNREGAPTGTELELQLPGASARRLRD